MRKWPEKHKMLLIVSLILAFATALYIYFILKPVWEEHSQAQSEMNDLNARLRQTIWPSDPDRLEALLAEYRRRLDKDNGTGRGQIEDTRKLLALASSMFDEMIIREYGSKADFMSKASQTEYKDQYDRLDTYLQGKNIVLDTSVFGMNELTSEPFKYQMLLKLWTTQAIVDCAINNKMRVTAKPLAGSRGRRASNITVLPMKSYYLNENDANPYVLEFPVQLELIGNMTNFSAFVDSLFTEGRFLPITNMELIAQPPQGGKLPNHDKEGNVNYHTIRVQIVCSSFFLPQAPPQQKEGTSSKTVVSERPAGI